MNPVKPLSQQSDLIEARRVNDRGKGGRGVFAARDIAKGTLIERVPVLLIPRNQVFPSNPKEPSPSPAVSWYVFEWEGLTKRDYVGLALGYGSLYNHSYEPNASYEKLPPDMMEFTAIVDIRAGEEICINYHGDPNDRRPVDFELNR